MFSSLHSAIGRLWESAVADQRMLDGIKIAVITFDGSDAEVHSKVEAALQLIKQHDPVRFNRLRADIAGGIRVQPAMTSTGRFVRKASRCELQFDHVTQNPVEHVASTIVHEATHARLHVAGIGYDEPIRFRVEQTCIRQEIAFLSRFPAGANCASRHHRQLELLTSGHYTNESFATRSRQQRWRILRELRENGTPRWAISLLVGTSRVIRWLRAVGNGSAARARDGSRS